MITWVVKYIHLFAMVSWMGGMIFFSYIAAPAAFKVLERQTAGDFVGAVFPKYFFLGYVASVVLLVTLYFIGRNNLAAVRAPLIIMAILTGLSFFHGMVIGTKARAIKAEVRQAEEGPKKDALRKSFGRIHGISAMLNLLIVLLCLVYLGFVPSILKL
jgi:uncharacterized membrane protein